MLNTLCHYVPRRYLNIQRLFPYYNRFFFVMKVYLPWGWNWKFTYYVQEDEASPSTSVWRSDTRRVPNKDSKVGLLIGVGKKGNTLRRSFCLQLQYVPEIYTRHSKSRDVHKIIRWLRLGCVCYSTLSFTIINFLNILVKYSSFEISDYLA